MRSLDEFITEHPEFNPIKLTFSEDMNYDFRSRILQSKQRIAFDDLFTCTVTNRKDTGMKIHFTFTPTIDPPENPDEVKTRESSWKLFFREGVERQFSEENLENMARYLHVETLLENFPLHFIVSHEDEIYERLTKIHERFFDRVLPEFIRGTTTPVNVFYNCLARNYHVQLKDLQEFLPNVDPCNLWYNPNVPNEMFYEYDPRLFKLLRINKDVPRRQIRDNIIRRNMTIGRDNFNILGRFKRRKNIPVTVPEITRIWFDALREKSSRFDIIKEDHPSYVTYQAMKKLEKLLYDCGVVPPIPVEEMLFLRKLPEEIVWSLLQEYLYRKNGDGDNDIFDLNVVSESSVEFLVRYSSHFWSTQLSICNVPMEFVNSHFDALDHHMLSLNSYLSEEFFRQHFRDLFWGFLFLNPTLTLQFFTDKFPGFSMILLSLNPLFQQIYEEGVEKRLLQETLNVIKRDDTLDTLPVLMIDIMDQERQVRERRKYHR